MVEKSRYWTPNRTYEFILKIGDIDITNDLHRVSILSSIDVPYQTVVIDLIIDPNDILLDQIYGQKPLKLTSNLLATDQYVMESIDFELMYLSSDLPINQKATIADGVQKDRAEVSIVTVVRKPYKTMNYFVNDISHGTTIDNVIQNLVSKTGATLKMDIAGRNTQVIDQILIPPATLYKTIMYLNSTFGIYNGMPSVHCSHDNVVHIKNLTKKMSDSQAFTVYQFALDSDNLDLINKADNGKNFYTRRDIDTMYKGNSVFGVLAPKMNFVVKPRDRLSYTIPITLETFAKTYGLISKNNKIFFDKTAISSDSRITTYKDHTGYELDSTFINSNISKNISHITETSVVVEQSMRLLNLMKVGESVQLISRNTETAPVTGRYILHRSELKFTKARDWSSSGLLTLIRTNRSGK